MRDPVAAGTPKRRGLILIALVCAAVLVGVGALQVWQLLQLGGALRSGSELRVVEMQRQETEYLQLREQWQRALNAAVPLDLRALSLSYEIWVGRAAMLKQDTASRRFAVVAQPQLDGTLRQVDAFVAAADPVLAPGLSDAARRAALAALLPDLLALGSPIHELALSAAHTATGDLTARHLALSEHTRVTLGLTAVLSLLVLAFVGLSLRQMQQLSRRQRALLDLTAELSGARADADAANQAKSRFLADMSHEMRTPFQGLLSMLSMLRETPLDARQVDYLRTANQSAEHLLAVLNDILDLSQLEAGRLQVNAAPLSLRTLMQEVEVLMRPEALARQLELHVQVADDVPPQAQLDGTRVKQVLFNLLSNALKFSQQGSVTLDLQLQPPAEGGGNLLFRVIDTGIGMDGDTLSRLFNRFERGPQASMSVPAGHGLGLEISRGLARRMGGDLQVSSVPGRGSRFDFTVPLLPVIGASAVVHTPLSEQPATAGLRVLIAEDHAVNRQVLAALLDRMGHHSHFVPNGQEALAAVQRQRFDLVLMDLHMPGLDGIEATRQIRALPDRAAATVPIVALTADAFTDTRERCLVAGMNDFLSKPVGREKLGALLRQLFGSGSGVEPAPQRDPMQSRCDAADPDTVRLLDPQVTTRLRETLGPQGLSDLLSGYFDQSASVVDGLRHAVRDAQPLDLRQHAHTARGAALNLGMPGLASTAKALQDGAAHLPAHEVARLVQRFENQLAATRHAAEQAHLVGAAVVTR